MKDGGHSPAAGHVHVQRAVYNRLTGFHSIEIFHEPYFFLLLHFLFILLWDELGHPEGTFFIQNINTLYFL